jgi:hypothetical protein
MGHRLGVDQVVDADDFDIPAARGPKYQPANAAKTVDANSNRHFLLLNSLEGQARYRSRKIGARNRSPRSSIGLTALGVEGPGALSTPRIAAKLGVESQEEIG